VLEVNSVHGHGSTRVGRGLRIEAGGEDGWVEGLWITGSFSMHSATPAECKRRNVPPRREPFSRSPLQKAWDVKKIELFAHWQYPFSNSAHAGTRGNAT